MKKLPAILLALVIIAAIGTVIVLWSQAAKNSDFVTLAKVYGPRSFWTGQTELDFATVSALRKAVDDSPSGSNGVSGDQKLIIRDLCVPLLENKIANFPGHDFPKLETDLSQRNGNYLFVLWAYLDTPDNIGRQARQAYEADFRLDDAGGCELLSLGKTASGVPFFIPEPARRTSKSILFTDKGFVAKYLSLQDKADDPKEIPACSENEWHSKDTVGLFSNNDAAVILDGLQGQRILIKTTCGIENKRDDKKVYKKYFDAYAEITTGEVWVGDFYDKSSYVIRTS